ncbi:OmpA family protein [Ruminococcaceae bacterium OttesenSCG-928-L11]|nr:OmpA family protein [Ruminococcaceae bacterium OttesenSCG-928-L11]
MARRKKGGGDGGGGGGDWLNTYADMVTLLLTFFILLFSMSSLDAAKFNMLVSAFASDSQSSDQIVIFATGDGSYESAANKGEVDAELNIEDLSSIYEALREYINANNLDDSVEVAKGEGYVFIRFMDEMLFQPNSARLKNPNMDILDFVGYGIKSIEHEVNMISVNGHTAAIPNDPDYAVSDRELSSQRANVVLRYLEDVSGVDSEKLIQVAFGKWKPFESNETEEGRAKNRRVEILISAENPIANQLDNVYEKLLES